MKQKTLKPLNRKLNAVRRGIYFILSLAFIVCVWWLAALYAKGGGLFPAPPEVLKRLFSEFYNRFFWRAIGNTLLKSVISFSIAFFAAAVLAVLARIFSRVKSFLDPLMTVLRSLPTLGATFILFMFFKSNVTTVVVGVLITLPLGYVNILASLESVDTKLLDMARIYKVGRGSQISGIFIPGITQLLFAAIIAGAVLNLKVIIAAEVVAVATSTTVGGYLNGAWQNFDYTALLMWVLSAVLISFIIEFLIKVIRRFCMPWKYPDRARLMRFFGRVGFFFGSLFKKVFKGKNRRVLK